MKIAVTIVRVLLGLMFVIFGLNGFLFFMPMPELPPSPARTWMELFSSTHYLQAIAAFQLLAGLILLSGHFVPLGLTILGPIVVNILLFHLLVSWPGMEIALVVAAMFAFLLYSYRAAFAPLFRAKFAA